jgi:hypothetical protein
MRIFTDIEKMVGAATELERVLGELGETPFEPLKEEQEEGVAETIMEKQVVVLNNTFVSFFKRNVPSPITSSSSTMFGGCQICKEGDHITTTCLRLIEPRPKCAKCGMSHRIENCGIKCSFCSGLGHLEDRCWKKPKDGKSHFGAANFLEVLLTDEGATTIVKDKIPEQQLVKEFAEATEVIDVVSEYERENGMSPYEEQPIAILSEINKGLVIDSVADRIIAELVDAATDVSENDETQVVPKELLIGRFKLAEATYGIDATDEIDVMMEDVLKMAGITIGQELGPKLGATKQGTYRFN